MRITIDKNAVSRAVRKPLEEYYEKSKKFTLDDDFDYERPGTWEENEDLFKSLFKSNYISEHLDWSYVLELIYAVIDYNEKLSPTEFSEKLEDLINQTTGQRDYIAIFPISFQKPFGFPISTNIINRSFEIGKFTFNPPATSLIKINNIFKKNGFESIDIDTYEHAKRSSRLAFSNKTLITFKTHGTEDQLRFNAQTEFTQLSRLLEIFANLFSEISTSFSQSSPANHFFLFNKTTKEFRRFPTIKPSTFDFELDLDFLKAIKRPEFSVFLIQVLESKETMFNRMRNAIKFFSMAFNTRDKVSAFIFYVISIESIFSKDKTAPIKATLADFTSMLCFPPDQRLDAHKKMRDIYDLRSAIVHSGTSSIRNIDIEIARTFAARAIYCSLYLCINIQNGHEKLENSFFNHLRDRKLDIAKEIIPKVIWSLPVTTINED